MYIIKLQKQTILHLTNKISNFYHRLLVIDGGKMKLKLLLGLLVFNYFLIQDSVAEEDTLKSMPPSKKHKILPEETEPMNLELNESGYVPLSYIVPGQLRVDIKNIENKANKQKSNLDKKEGKLNFENHKSTLTLNEAIPVVKYIDDNQQFLYRVIDNHHEFLASLENKSTHFPIRVVDDLTKEGPNPIIQMEERGYVDLYDKDGNRHEDINLTWEDLAKEHDPLRAFITKNIMKVQWGTNTIEQNPENPLIVKAVASKKFKISTEEIICNTHLENRLSTALRQKKFNFNEGTTLENMRSFIFANNINENFPGVRFVMDKNQVNMYLSQINNQESLQKNKITI